MRVKLDISYDGHNYIGFQRQPQGATIQNEIEKVLSQIFNQSMTITASGRTDAGVHALHQIVTFNVDKKIKDLEKLRYSLNCLLPADIHINDASVVDNEFHPRASAVSKTYLYYLNMGEQNPFYINYRYEFKRILDVNRMQNAAKLFIGEHNFKNFTTKEEDNLNYIRLIYEIEITQNENIVCFRFKGNGFMRYMVRMIVGVLIMIGLNKENEEFIVSKLNDSQRNPVIYKAPPQGLYLAKISYDKEEIK